MLSRCNGRGKRTLAALITTTVAFFGIAAAQAQDLDVFTIAGSGAAGFQGDGALATDASVRINGPAGVVKDPVTGNLYIADLQNHVIRQVSAGGIISTIAGTPGVAGYTDGDAAAAQFDTPYSIDLDLAGNLIIADLGNNLIRKLDVATSTVSTIAGVTSTGPSMGEDGAPPNGVRFKQPIGVSVGPDGSIYVADRRNNVIRKIEADLSAVNTVVGSHPADNTAAERGFGGDGGPATSAVLDFPQGVFVDPLGNIAIADSGNHVIRWVDVATGNISTVAGTGEVAGFTGDGGLATAARMRLPRAVHVDGANIYVADVQNHRVRVFTIGGNIDTFAGSGATGAGNGDFNGEGAPATDSLFNDVQDVFVDGSGNVLIADTGNHRIRETRPATLNQAPTDIVFRIEDLPIDVKSSDGSGARVARLVTQDPDEGDTHTYELTTNGVGGADSRRFAITGANNVLRVNNPRLTYGDLEVRVISNDGVDATLEKAFVITVVDDMLPTITLLGDNPQIVALNDPYVEAGATAIDNSEAELDLTADIVIDASAVDTSVPGDYTVTYDVSDASGNAAVQVLRTVSVEGEDPIETNSNLGADGAGPDTLETDAAGTYVITVTNGGPDDTTAVVATIDVPTDILTVDTATASQGSCAISGATITCELGDLANAASADITVDVTAGSAAGTGDATFSVVSANDDSDTSDNTGTVSITVEEAAAPPPPPPPPPPPTPTPSGGGGGGSTGFFLLGMLALIGLRRRLLAQ